MLIRDEVKSLILFKKSIFNKVLKCFIYLLSVWCTINIASYHVFINIIIML